MTAHGSTLHVAITGASSGIGRALALEFGRNGAAVSLVARRRALLEECARELPGPSAVIACDLGAGDPSSWIGEAEAALGPIGLLINNAGVERIAATAEMGREETERLMRVNLLAPLEIIRSILPGMLARGAGGIINISSVMALAPPPGMAFYGASKAGLAAASESLRGELAKTPVRVLTVYPGLIATAMGQASMAAYEPSLALRLHPSATPEQLARAIRKAWLRGRPRLIYPRSNATMRWFPTLMRWTMDHFTPPLANARAQPSEKTRSRAADD